MNNSIQSTFSTFPNVIKSFLADSSDCKCYFSFERHEVRDRSPMHFMFQEFSAKKSSRAKWSDASGQPVEPYFQCIDGDEELHPSGK